MEAKTITAVVPTYNEQENIPLVYQKIANIFEQYRDKYNLEILFFDNCSKAKSRELIMELAQYDLRVKAIFNAKNFGFTRSTFYGLTQATGECAILIFADMQDPSEIMHHLCGIIAEIGFQRSEVNYTQEKRKQGKTKFNFLKLYDLAMLGITSYSKIIMRLATLIGFGIAIISLFIAGCTFIYKLFNWDSYPIGNAAISMGVFFFGAVQLFFVGLLGEYILNINTRVMHHPLVIEEKRINFEKTAEAAKEPAHHGTE